MSSFSHSSFWFDSGFGFRHSVFVPPRLLVVRRRPQLAIDARTVHTELSCSLGDVAAGCGQGALDQNRLGFLELERQIAGRLDRVCLSGVSRGGWRRGCLSRRDEAEVLRRRSFPPFSIRARSITFFSSRMFPRKGCAANWASASGSILGAAIPISAAKSPTKCAASSGMSSRRSRSGGTSTVNCASRK